MSNTADLIKAYSSEPINQYVMDEYDVVYTQGNSICGDTITIYIQFSDDKKMIKQFSHAGSPQMFTLAAASMLAETIEGSIVSDVLQWGGSYMESLGLDVSPRRKRSTVSALLAVHNGLVEYFELAEKLDYEAILAL